ncbi:A24 family peptidase, partial [Patescibacteria group bacterium]|nr:A24 family peptidase [Patescibacteria group bacterium]
WVLQKGRSRCCDSPLLWSYPVVELMMGMLFVGWFLIWNETRHASLLHLLLGFVVIVFLLFGLIMDLKYMVLPDFGTVILCVSALVFWYVGGKNDFWNYFLSGIGSFGFLLLLHLVTKGNGMGMGDVKLAFFMGTFLGFKGVVMAFYIAFVFGAVVGVILLLLKKAKRKTVIAFGPFLIIGTLLSWWWGEKIILIFNSQFLINF